MLSLCWSASVSEDVPTSVPAGPSSLSPASRMAYAVASQLGRILGGVRPVVHDVALTVDLRVGQHRVQVAEVGLGKQVEPQPAADQRRTGRHQGSGHAADPGPARPPPSNRYRPLAG
jgi:hypothetical protein